MTCAYWCVLAAIMLPYIWVTVAKAGGFDNAAPRDSLASLVGWRRRADWAHLNAFEAIPSFAAAVIIATQIRIPSRPRFAASTTAGRWWAAVLSA